MGDYRADIKLEFSILGETFKTNMWINYFPDNDGVDRRVTEWFSSHWELAKAKQKVKELSQLELEQQNEM